MIHNTGQKESGECSDIRDRILELFEESSGLDEHPHIINHLNKCEGCQRLYASLESVENQFQKSPEKCLEPNPEIRKNIIRYLELRTRMRSGKKETIVDWVKSIFTFRIPVYQALGGFAVILILFIFMSGLKSNGGIWWMEIDYSTKSEEYHNADLYVLDTLHLLNASNGQNALEDSILISFLESSL